MSDLGKTCAVSHPETIFSLSRSCSSMATARRRNHFNSVIKQTGQSAKRLGIQTFTVTSRIALGPVGIWSIFAGVKQPKPEAGHLTST